jgi:ABC-type transporter Mla subunit MlaD
MKTLKETIKHVILSEELSNNAQEIGSFAADFNNPEVKQLASNLSNLDTALTAIDDNNGEDITSLEDALNEADVSLDQVIPQLDQMLSAARILRKLVTKELTSLDK